MKKLCKLDHLKYVHIKVSLKILIVLKYLSFIFKTNKVLVFFSILEWMSILEEQLVRNNLFCATKEYTYAHFQKTWDI